MLDARTTSDTKDPMARLLRGGSNPSDSPKLPSKSKWVVHGVVGSSYHHDGGTSASEGAKDVNNDVAVDEGRATSR